MKKKYIIAFDQGTTSTRAIIFDDKGTIRNIAQKELTQHYPKQGWVEHDPIEIFEAQQATFKEVIETFLMFWVVCFKNINEQFYVWTSFYAW